MRNGWSGAAIGLGLAGGLMCLSAAHAQSTPQPNPAKSKSDEAALKAAKARMADRIRAKTPPPSPPPTTALPREMKPPRYDSLPQAPPPSLSPPLPRYDPPPPLELPDTSFQVTATADGKAVYAVGYLAPGSFKKLKKIMDANAKADTLIIASPGGLVVEGAMAAHYVRARKLNVVAHYICASSCTMILAAGKERVAKEGTHIGFHRSYSPFSSRYYPKETKGFDAVSDVIFRQSYEKSAVDPGFIEKAMKVPSTTLWYPDQEALIRAGILSRKAKDKDQFILPAKALTRPAIAEKLFQISFWKDARRVNNALVDEAVDNAWLMSTLSPTVNDAETNALQHLTDRVLVSLPALSDASLGLVATALNAHFAQKVTDGQVYCGRYDTRLFDFFSRTSAQIPPDRQALIIEMLKTPPEFSEMSEDEALASLATLMVEVGAADGLSSTDVITIGFSGGQCKTMAKIYAYIATLSEKDRARTLRGMVALPDAIAKLSKQMPGLY